ncbi:hypothetical protein [Moorena sp. SIO4G3]|uniref:hypothetical protein n=1 Tax=Moorena sp. SIO4G3 TaxID=2607821 RepID=UPI00142CA23F|nr:hypothetical protein [Moorena sp. SIO4G3]NEO78812.1 hypothetical protein [Moorena sp. SIO4G3]
MIGDYRIFHNYEVKRLSLFPALYFLLPAPCSLFPVPCSLLPSKLKTAILDLE